MKILKINKVLLILSLIFGISFITNYNNYDGNKLIFLIFHIICLISILKLFNKKISSIEFYLIVFFILSFWLKFSYLIYTKNFSIIEGNYNVNKSTLDDATLIIIVSLLACVFSGYIREILIENNLTLPWLISSLVLAYYGYYLIALPFSGFFFLTGLRQVHNGFHNALGTTKFLTWFSLYGNSLLIMSTLAVMAANSIGVLP